MDNLSSPPGYGSRYVASMIRITPPLFLLITLTGCDAVSRTELTVRSKTTTATLDVRDVVRIASKTAERFGLAEAERKDTYLTFTDHIAGQNPDIWLTVEYPSNSPTISIWEMYIAHPTDKHKQIAHSIMEELDSAGYTVHIDYQSPGARTWPWLLGVAAVLAMGLLFWRFLRRQPSRTPTEIAT